MNSTYLIHKGLFTSGGSFHSLGHANSREVMQVLGSAQGCQAISTFSRLDMSVFVLNGASGDISLSIHNCLIHSNPFHSIDMDILNFL